MGATHGYWVQNLGALDLVGHPVQDVDQVYASHCSLLLAVVVVLETLGLDWDTEKEKFGDNVVNTIAEYAPNIKDIILHRQVVTPLDLERTWGLTEGNIFQGELSLEQLFFLRPVAGWAQFRSPIKNLYMCGSATHPGGGIMGAPGRLAALEILKDGKAA